MMMKLKIGCLVLWLGCSGAPLASMDPDSSYLALDPYNLGMYDTGAGADFECAPESIAMMSWYGDIFSFDEPAAEVAAVTTVMPAVVAGLDCQPSDFTDSTEAMEGTEENNNYDDDGNGAAEASAGAPTSADALPAGGRRRRWSHAEGTARRAKLLMALLDCEELNRKRCERRSRKKIFLELAGRYNFKETVARALLARRRLMWQRLCPT